MMTNWRKIYNETRTLLLTNFNRNHEIKYLRKRIQELEKQQTNDDNYLEYVKSNFLKNLYHEIRTPLNAITGFTELLQNNQLHTNTDLYYRHIQNSSVKLLEIIDHLVEASIIQAGTLKLENSTFNLHEKCTELYIRYSMHKHISEKNIALLLNVPPTNRGLQVVSDPKRITQVLSILLANAFKYTSKGVIEFGFHIENSNIVFHVKDTGNGDLQGKEDSIFTSFSKLNNSDTSDEGLGLGLHISKNIIEKMGGKIWVTAHKETGTNIYFTLPYIPISGSSKVASNHTNITRTQSIRLNTPKAIV